MPPLLEYSAALPGLSPGCSLSRAARLQGGQFTSLQDELNRPSGRSSAIQQDAHRRRAKSFPPGGSSGSQSALTALARTTDPGQEGHKHQPCGPGD